MSTDNTDRKQRRGKHDEITERVIGVFYDVYNELGFGFLEVVYREAMRLALTRLCVSTNHRRCIICARPRSKLPC